MKRRDALSALAGAAAMGALPMAARASTSAATRTDVRTDVRAGRLKQSVSRWCYGKIPLDDLCEAAKGMGLVAIDLLDEKDWGVPKQHGLVCAMANGFGTIPKGFNRPNQHDQLVADAEKMIPAAAAAGVPNIVCFSGNRGGMGDAEGVGNCIVGLKRLAPLAEKHGVTLCLELLNSKVDHKDYQADSTSFGAAVVKGVGSPRVKLLYDIYHMQIMEGNVVDTIKANLGHIGHFHTGGVPGRNEIDETQELNYRRVAQVIADSGYAGYLAHEFVPRRDPMASLRQAAEICTV